MKELKKMLESTRPPTGKETKQFNPPPAPKYKLTPEEKEAMVKRYAKGGPVKRGYGKARSC